MHFSIFNFLCVMYIHVCVPLFVWVGITFLPLYSLASVLCTMYFHVYLPCSLQDMPAWKRNLVKKRRDEQAVSEAEKQRQQAEWEAKLAEIAAMPDWKRKMFLERNPQYKTD